jgi:hypothetical protein
MTWRGSTTPLDRFLSALAYLLPLSIGVFFGLFLIQEFPILKLITIPVAPVLMLYGSLGPFSGILIFMVLFFLVVRNERIAHFIRFNVMQAILLEIALTIVSILAQTFGMTLLPVLAQVGDSQILLLVKTLASAIFLGTVAAVVYGIVQCALGLYPDQIPAVSDATYAQVR